jgi:sugar phosphate isomerase/epimerase
VPPQFDIGISSGAYQGLALGDALVRIAELAPLAEICSWGHHSLLDPVNARAVECIGLPITVHGPFLHDGLGNRTQSRRRSAIEAHLRHIWVAAELGAKAYVVHPDLQSRNRRWNPTTVVALQRSFETLRAVEDELGIAIVVENLRYARRSHFTTPGDLDLQGLGFALDVGHAAMTGTLSRWLDEPDVHLRHVHLHDNLGHQGGDLHHALGTGVVEAGRAVAAARAAGATVVLEHFREADVLASLAHLENGGLDWPPNGYEATSHGDAEAG